MASIESGITSRGQTTLPKAVRRALAVQAGDRVRYIIDGDTVRIVPVRPVNRLFGVLRHDDPAVSLEEMEQAAAEGASLTQQDGDA
jgi:AbrB family looped-hinge helix DNA binding protein